VSDDLILVDSTVWVHFLRGIDPLLGERLTPLIVADRLVTSPVIILEILRGARDLKHYTQLDEDFSALRCLAMTDALWQRANRLAFTLRTKGVNAPLTDTLIAATALEHGLPLLHDDRHFEAIAGIVPLLRQERLGPAQRD